MDFVILTIDGVDYKLRLGAQEIIQLEKKLGGNVLDVFMKTQAGKLPTLLEVLTILHASMVKFNSNIKMEEMYNLYDRAVAQGIFLTDLMAKLTEVMQISGFFKKVEE